MTSTPNPTWYDVLGVSRDASPTQIKAAWRNATDKFEPGSGSGQFRMFNEAADVLLDPARRMTYDASLAPQAQAQAPTSTDMPVDLSEPSGPSGPSDLDAPPPPLPEERVRGSRWGRNSRTASASAAAGAPERASRTAVVLAAVLALLMVGALVAAGFFALKVRTDNRVADARDEAPAAAERSAKAMLSYDYRHLPTDRKRASGYLTDGFKKKYLKNFTLLEKQKDGTPGAAIQTKTVVTSSVLGSGVMDAEERVVRVLVYVNQTSTRPGKDPQIFQNRVAMTMDKVGNRWLVDDLKSY